MNAFESDIYNVLNDLPEIHTIPGQIEAESYSGMNGIRTENCSDTGGGLNVGYLDPGDWLEYNVDVAETGYYMLEYRLAGLNHGIIELLDDKGNKLSSLNVPVTEGWQNWETAVGYLNLEEGQQSILLKIISDGFNINWMRFTNITGNDKLYETNDAGDGFIIYPNPAQDNVNILIPADRVRLVRSIQLYNMDGRLIMHPVLNGRNRYGIPLSGIPPGLYIIRIETTDSMINRKVIIH